MTNLTDNQRAALTALRDVMDEHGIEIDLEDTSPSYGCSYKVVIDLNYVPLYESTGNISADDLSKILEQETE